VLINITGGPDLSLHEVNEAASLIQEEADEDANIIFGAVIDESMGDEVRITVIATGFGEQIDASQRPGSTEARAARRAEDELEVPTWQRRRQREAPSAPARATAAQPASAAARGSGEEPSEEDFDVPTFLRRGVDS